MYRDEVVAAGTSPADVGDLEESLPPVRKSVVVPLTTFAAFDLFVRRLNEWWPLAGRSVFLEDAVSCHVEPHLGGRLYERSRDGREETWGRFSTFEDGRRVVFSWHHGISVASATPMVVADGRVSELCHIPR